MFTQVRPGAHRGATFVPEHAWFTVAVPAFSQSVAPLPSGMQPAMPAPLFPPQAAALRRSQVTWQTFMFGTSVPSVNLTWVQVFVPVPHVVSQYGRHASKTQVSPFAQPAVDVHA